MANTLTSIYPKILASALRVLRENCWAPQLVFSDMKNEVAQKGDTINFPLPGAALPTTAVVPGAVPPQQPDTAITTVPLVLSTWTKSGFYLTEQQMGNLDANQSFLEINSGGAMRALSNGVNAGLLGLFTGVYGRIGVPGTTPFGANINAANSLMQTLTNQVAPLNPRRLIIDPNAEANAKNLTAFGSYLEAGTTLTKVEGQIGRKYGMDWFVDQQVPSFTAGTASSATITTGANANVGDTVIGLKASAGTPTLVVGDILVQAGDTQTYVVTAAIALSTVNQSVSISPAIKVATVSGAAVTVDASCNRVGMAFHPEAFGLAVRPVSGGPIPNGVSDYIQDPVSKLFLNLQVTYQYHQWAWEYSILYGSTMLRPDLACRLAG